jgi:RNA polymerase sigma-70 factor (ECF subfamily)
MTQGRHMQLREKDNRMQTPDSYACADENPGLPCGPERTQALEQILSAGLASFYRQAYRLLGNRADAEDAVQDALLAAYTHLDQFRGQSQISTWLTTIVLNCARLQLRRRIRHVHVPLEESIGENPTISVLERIADQRSNPEEDCRYRELTTQLNHFHAQLSPTLRRTFQLRVVEGLSIRETARILGVPAGTVKAQSARARRKLKQWMRRACQPRPRRRPNRFLPGGHSVLHSGALGTECSNLFATFRSYCHDYGSSLSREP